MIEVPEWEVSHGCRFEIVDNMDNQIAIAFNIRDAQLISQLPNMVMVLQRVIADYEGMFNDPTDSHIYTDIIKVLEDAEYREEPMH